MSSRRISLFFIISVVSLWSIGHAHAAGMKGVQLTIEPIVGYEYARKLYPTPPHNKSRLLYGARVTAGIVLLSVEAELTRSQDTEEAPTIGQTIKEQADRLKLGIRSGISLGIAQAFLRAGGQASQITDEVVQNGVTTTTVNPIIYKPYGGLGARARLGKNFSFSADVLAVFNDFPNMEANEYQTTAGFVVSLP